MSYVWIPILIIGLLVCGGFGAYVADSRGRPGIEGFVFSAVLGPIGVIVAGLLPEREKTSSKRETIKIPDAYKFLVIIATLLIIWILTSLL
jgi:hypothetical protein